MDRGRESGRAESEGGCPEVVKPNVADDPPPDAPTPPEPEECCGSGCTHCVFDLYDAARERYLLALAAWRARQDALRIPE